MAFIEGLWTATFSFVDNNENVASCSVNYAGSLGHAEVELAAAALAADLQAVSNARLKRYQVTKTYGNDDLSAIAAESEVERKLRITLGTATRQGAASIEVPSPVFSIEQVNTDNVDPANPLVAALISELTAGLALPGNGPVTWFGADIVQASFPVIIHRNRKARD